MMKMATCFTTAALVLAGTTASADVINGDFEADPFNDSWTGSGAAETTGLNGSASAANMNATGSLGQANDAVLADFTAQFTFSLTTMTDDRSLNVILHSGGSDGSSTFGSTLNLRVDTNGDLQRFSGGWATVAGGAGAFTTGNEYTLQIVGSDWDGTASYDLLWSDAGSTVLSNSALGLTAFQNAPTAGGLSAIRFARGAGDGEYVVDDVSIVPEPGSLALLGLGGLLVARRRRG